MLDNMAASNKRYRLEREHEGRVEQRRNRLNELYMRTAKAHLDPDDSPFLPGINILQNVPQFQDYLHDRAEAVVDVTVPDAEWIIRSFIALAIHHKKQYLIQIMAKAGVTAIADDHSADDILGLATALFQCCNEHARVFIGWDEAGVHTRPPPKRFSKNINFDYFPLEYPCRGTHGLNDTLVESEFGVDLKCKFAYCTGARDVLEQIAGLLDVDWRVVPAKTLDALGRRFVCKTCPFWPTNGAYGLDAMDWRECVRIPP